MTDTRQDAFKCIIIFFIRVHQTITVEESGCYWYTVITIIIVYFLVDPPPSPRGPRSGRTEKWWGNFKFVPKSIILRCEKNPPPLTQRRSKIISSFPESRCRYCGSESMNLFRIRLIPKIVTILVTNFTCETIYGP